MGLCRLAEDALPWQGSLVCARPYNTCVRGDFLEKRSIRNMLTCVDGEDGGAVDRLFSRRHISQEEQARRRRVQARMQQPGGAIAAAGALPEFRQAPSPPAQSTPQEPEEPRGSAVAGVGGHVPGLGDPSAGAAAAAVPDGGASGSPAGATAPLDEAAGPGHASEALEPVPAEGPGPGTPPPEAAVAAAGGEAAAEHQAALVVQGGGAKEEVASAELEQP